MFPTVTWQHCLGGQFMGASWITHTQYCPRGLIFRVSALQGLPATGPMKVPIEVSRQAASFHALSGPESCASHRETISAIPPYCALWCLFRGPQMGGQIRHGRIWRFWGAPIFSPEVPKYLFLKGFGTSGRKIGAPQKRQIQPRRI